MSLAENKDVIRMYFDEVVNRGNLSLIDHTVAARAEGLRQVISMFFAAFPDAKTTIDDMIAEGDKVVVRSTTRATRTGALMGVAPTGRPVRYSGIDIFRVVESKITDHWFVRDHATLMEQLGILPKMGRAR